MSSMQDLGLTEEQRLIRDNVRALARERFAPNAAHADKKYRPPVENMKVLAEHGYTGLFMPDEYGGAGLGLLENVLVGGVSPKPIFFRDGRPERPTPGSA